MCVYMCEMSILRYFRDKIIIVKTIMMVNEYKSFELAFEIRSYKYM